MVKERPGVEDQNSVRATTVHQRTELDSRIQAARYKAFTHRTAEAHVARRADVDSVVCLHPYARALAPSADMTYECHRYSPRYSDTMISMVVHRR